MTETGVPDAAIWLEAAADPEIVAMEKQIGELYGLESDHYRLARELEGYYWNSGLPHTALEVKPGVWMGREENRMSFAWDRPKESWQLGFTDRLLRRTRFLNDETQRGRLVMGVNDDVLVVEKDGKEFLVRDGVHVISPKFDHVEPAEDGSFTVTLGEETGSLRLLTTEEQEAVLKKRAKHDEHSASYDSRELLELQHQAALATLALYGVSIDPEETKRYSASNVKELHFTHAGSYVRMGVGGEALRIMSWGEELTHEQRHEVWRAYDGEDGVQSVGMQLSILLDAIDRGVPDWLKEYEDRIIAEIDDTDQANKIFLASVRELFERNNFRPFSVETPHPSWSIPVAMKLLELPFDEAYPIIAPYGSESGGSFYQNSPGQFHAGWETPKKAWALDSSGELVEK